MCGASAISPTWAVTAAHCLDSGYPAYVVSFAHAHKHANMKSGIRFRLNYVPVAQVD